MTRKIIVVPWIVSTALYELFVRKCSFGVASCVRMSSARMPPNAKKTSDCPDVHQPDALVVDGRQPRREAAASPVGAIRPDAFDVHGHLGAAAPLRTASCTRRARRSAPVVQFLPTGGICPRPLRSSVSMPVRLASSGLFASAGPMYLWSRRWHDWQAPCHSSAPTSALEAFAKRAPDEGVVLRARDDMHGRDHVRVLDAAQLGAAREVVAGRRLEPRRVDPAGDRVHTCRRGRAPTTSG